MAIQWTPDLAVGIAEIDEQHHRLVALIDEFYGSIRETPPREGVAHLLSGMADYTRYHFDAEERLMREHAYPGLDAQVVQHNHFVDKVEDVARRFGTGQLVLSLEVTAFLRDWLSQHILGADKAMGQYLVAHGAR